MDLNTIESVIRPASRADLPQWSAGDALLAGGTWLFSEPQPHLRRLVDLADLKWPSLVIRPGGLEIAATCTVAELDELICPPDWLASALFAKCSRAFLASFKIWKTATVGGNLCMALPAGPMISLTASLGGVCTIWTPDGGERQVDALDFVTGNGANCLSVGEILRKIDIPAKSLRRRAAFRKISLTSVGRSAALLIGTRDESDGLSLTVTASTVRPVQLGFKSVPDSSELRAALDAALPPEVIHNDVHGKPAWRRHMTFRLAEEIRRELADVASR